MLYWCVGWASTAKHSYSRLAQTSWGRPRRRSAQCSRATASLMTRFSAYLQLMRAKVFVSSTALVCNHSRVSRPGSILTDTTARPDRNLIQHDGVSQRAPHVPRAPSVRPASRCSKRNTRPALYVSQRRLSHTLTLVFDHYYIVVVVVVVVV